jgi:hypothetical protein
LVLVQLAVCRTLAEECFAMFLEAYQSTLLYIPV